LATVIMKKNDIYFGSNWPWLC